MKKLLLSVSSLLFIFGFISTASTDDLYHPKRILPVAKSKAHPFAKHHIVFHISSGSGFEQRLVLNNASNISRHYGPDNVAVEVVAYGPGLRLLFKENVQANRIKGLAGLGVTFSACGNTMKAMGRKMSGLIKGTKYTPAGVARIVELQEAGWTYIRP